MTPLYQADSRWTSLLLGNGPSTIGKGGCLLVCLTMAARELGTHPAVLPPHVNARLLAARCFDGDMLRVHDAADVLGLVAPLFERVSLDDKEKPATADDVAAALGLAMRAGLAILHVDHDSAKAKGDAKGDHFILAVTLEKGDVMCLDPAIGRVVLGFPELDGLAVWGKGDVRNYRVRAVRPIRRAPT
jgi:hypothetical protein